MLTTIVPQYAPRGTTGAKWAPLACAKSQVGKNGKKKPFGMKKPKRQVNWSSKPVKSPSKKNPSQKVKAAVAPIPPPPCDPDTGGENMETDDEPYEPKSPEYEKDSNDEGSNDEGSGDISDNEHMETDGGEPYEPKSPLGAPPKSPEDKSDNEEGSDDEEDSFMGRKKPDGTNAEAFKIGATMGDIGKRVCVQFKGYNCPQGITAGWHQGKVAYLVKQHAEYNEATRTYTSLTIPDQGHTDYAAITFGSEITIVKFIHIFAYTPPQGV
jgi:hypothetical protein